MSDTFFADIERVHNVVNAPGSTIDKLAELLPLLHTDSDVVREFWSTITDKPEWLQPLLNEKFFNNAPPTEIADNGGRRYPNWPASKYLIRIASQEPASVAEILKGINTDNSSVISDLVDAALDMPSRYSVTLVPKIALAAKNDLLWVASKEASLLCIKLANEGKASDALILADAMFSPRLESGEKKQSRRDDYWYKKGLTSVTPVLAVASPNDYLSHLCSWLDSAIKSKGYSSIDHGNDLSSTWRPAIEDHEQNHDWDFAGTLVGIVRMGFETALSKKVIELSDALAVLRHFEFTIFKRMRIHLINKYATDDEPLARATMMDRSLFDAVWIKHEYAMLVENQLDLLTHEEMTRWYSWIDAGPDMSDYDAQILKRTGKNPTEEQRYSRIEYWKFMHLNWVLRHLTDEQREFYDRMLKSHGEPELANLNSKITTRWGNESPMIQDDLMGKQLAEVITIVSEWKPDASQHHWGANIDGLASTFSQYLATNPKSFSREAQEMKNASPVFVTKFMDQMASAVKSGEMVEVKAVLALSQWILDQPIEEAFSEDDSAPTLVDRSWRYARQSVLTFVENVCTARESDRPKFAEKPFRGDLWGLLEKLYRDPSASNILRDTTTDDPRTHDYLDLGINSARGRAVEAAMEYAKWVAIHNMIVEDGHEILPDGFKTMPEVREMLMWQIEPDNRCVETMSVIGSRLGLLHWIDRKWLEDTADQLFNLSGLNADPPETYGWAAWNAFLVWGHPHREFYQAFHNQYAQAVDAAVNLPVSEEDSEGRPLGMLGEHLMVLYGRGDIGFDDDPEIFTRFLTEASSSIRRHAVGFVGRTLQQDPASPQDVIDRFVVMWERYWSGPGKSDAENAPTAWLFGQWYVSSQFDREWAIKQLLEYTNIVGTPEPDYAVAERLAEDVNTDVDSCLSILHNMVHGDKEGWHVHSLIESARVVLTAALAETGDTRIRAEELTNHLGRRGFMELGELLKP